MRLLTCILIALAFVAIYADEPEKLVNGTPTTIKEWPHAISLRLNNQHSCGGSIISSKCILTAAHCVEPFKSTRGLTVVSGTTYLNSGGVHHEIAELKAHEGYGEDGSHDIGLIKLSQPIKFDENTQPIKLPTSDIEKGDGVTLVAWGSKGFLRPIHNDLQKIEANCMPWDECKRSIY
ncbi:trypsin delta-like [Nylanderia fulva]|uniref:trypsin delta-like n=1 Tax=Nylanderia fulva TaxID=613905 RepID=UPI0010FBB646|nr:trypsin delta-like [Nylanderia fulva]